MKRRISVSCYVVIALFMAGLLLASCVQPIQPYGTGSITLTMAVGGIARTITPPADKTTIAAYRISGTGPGGATFQPFQSDSSTVTIGNLAAGTWTITVGGLDAENIPDIRATGSVSVLIETGKTTAASITLSYIGGVGNMVLDGEWPVTVTAVYEITGQLTPAVPGNDSFVFLASDATLHNGNALYGKIQMMNIPTGSYSVEISFRNVAGEVIGSPMMEIVNIYANLTSTGYFAMPENFFPAAKPTFSLESGLTYPDGQQFTMTTATTDGQILYTVDGSTPTMLSILYEGPVTLHENTIVKAVTVRNDMTTSPMATATYNIRADTPTFNIDPGIFESERIVTISSTTPGVTIHYTTTGLDPSVSSATYSGPLTISTNTTLKAIAVKNKMVNSYIQSSDYVIKAAKPTFSPVAGTYAVAQYVTLSSTTTGASIFYTKDGSDPTDASTLYTAPVHVTETSTLKSFTVKEGMADSDISTASYVIHGGAGLDITDPVNYTVTVNKPSDWITWKPISNVNATITATLTPTASPSVTYTWYLDGVLARNNSGEIASTTSTIVLGVHPTDIATAVGPHVLTLVVTEGTMSFSGGLSFNSVRTNGEGYVDTL